jgi:hypothetical protein
MALGSNFAVSGQTSMTGLLPGIAAWGFSATNAAAVPARDDLSES